MFTHTRRHTSALLALGLSVLVLPSLSLSAFSATPAKAPAAKSATAAKSFTTPSVADTPQSRENAAKAYLKVQPVEQLYEETVVELSSQVPKEKRSEFLEMMAGAVDMSKLEQLALESLKKNFTASELTYMTQFYGSSTGKSIYQKFPNYLSDIGYGLKDVINLPPESSQTPATTAPGAAAPDAAKTDMAKPDATKAPAAKP